MIPLLLSSLSTFVAQLRGKKDPPTKIEEEIVTIPALAPVWKLGQDPVSGEAFTVGMQVVMIIAKFENDPDADPRSAAAAKGLLDVIEAYTRSVSFYLGMMPSMEYVKSSKAPGAVLAREAIAEYEMNMRAVKHAIQKPAYASSTRSTRGWNPLGALAPAPLAMAAPVDDDALMRCNEQLDAIRKSFETRMRRVDLDGEAPNLLPPDLLAADDELSTIAPTESTPGSTVNGEQEEEELKVKKTKQWRITNDAATINEPSKRISTRANAEASTSRLSF